MLTDRQSGPLTHFLTAYIHSLPDHLHPLTSWPPTFTLFLTAFIHSLPVGLKEASLESFFSLFIEFTYLLACLHEALHESLSLTIAFAPLLASYKRHYLSHFISIAFSSSFSIFIINLFPFVQMKTQTKDRTCRACGGKGHSLTPSKICKNYKRSAPIPPKVAVPMQVGRYIQK